MSEHPGCELQFTVKIPANSRIDLGDRWFDLMMYIIEHNDESPEKITFTLKDRKSGDEQWRTCDTEKSFEVDGEVDD